MAGRSSCSRSGTSPTSPVSCGHSTSTDDPRLRRSTAALPGGLRRPEGVRALRGHERADRRDLRRRYSDAVRPARLLARRALPRRALPADRALRRLPAAGYAQHPYANSRGAFGRTPADDVTIGTLGRLVSALDRAGAAGAISPRLPIYITEFGVQSYPNPSSASRSPSRRSSMRSASTSPTRTRASRPSRNTCCAMTGRPAAGSSASSPASRPIAGRRSRPTKGSGCPSPSRGRMPASRSGGWCDRRRRQPRW